MPGISFPPEKYHDCVVRDRKNWSCRENEMIDGKEKSYYGVKYVSKYRWWYLHLKSHYDSEDSAFMGVLAVIFRIFTEIF
jgi:hypothetical protein